MINEVRGMKEVLIRVEADEPTAKEFKKQCMKVSRLEYPWKLFLQNPYQDGR